jgi:hypothetical protein
MLVSVTRLRLRSSRFLLPFFWYSLRSAREAKRSPGNVVTQLLRDDHGGYWTRSVWQDERSMRAFMMSGSHRRAMPKLLDWCDEAALVHWEQDGAAPPDWQEAHRRLVSQGRTSKVRHPSPAQSSLAYPPPKSR